MKNVRILAKNYFPQKIYLKVMKKVIFVFKRLNIYFLEGQVFEVPLVRKQSRVIL